MAASMAFSRQVGYSARILRGISYLVNFQCFLCCRCTKITIVAVSTFFFFLATAFVTAKKFVYVHARIKYFGLILQVPRASGSCSGPFRYENVK